MNSRLAATAPILAAILLLATPAALVAEDRESLFGGLADPFARDIAQEDEDYFATPPETEFSPDSETFVTLTAASEEPAKPRIATPPAAVPAPVAAFTQASVSPIDTFFLFLCGALVLLMQAGFAMLEAGFNSSKHTVNNLFKNVLNVAVGGLVFFLVGYRLMFPAAPIKENYIGQVAPGIDGSVTTSGSPAVATSPNEQIHFLYRFALAATAAAIVSGAVAGRMKFGASVVCAAVVAGVVYPVVGYWKWGGGWLDDMGFYDFAGSGVVHMVGGFAGLAGAVLLGPRIGRYTPDGKPIAIPGHSLPLATLGVFVLFAGWYGFNAGGQLGLSRPGDAASVGLIAVNTTLAACAGCCLATALSWILFGKPDLSMALSGLLGGLVGIAAGCDGVTNLESIVIGAVSGGAVVLATIVLDKLRVDDPVGAFPVHGVCGMWGLLACALFGDASWGTAGGTPTGPDYGNPAAQLAGLLAIAAFSFVCMLGLFGILKTVGFLRVLPEEEERGLDISEHRMSAYAA